MLVKCYDSFVRSTDQSGRRSREERIDIATYGLASEVGSVVAAIKKQLLAEGGEAAWHVASDEVVDELGDVIWYLFALSHALRPEQPINIFALDIANLRAEVGAGDARAERIQGILGPERRDVFLRAADDYMRIGEATTFENYQQLAFLTARTEDRTLVEVCFAVLWQLSAELLRRKLPDFERELNRGIVDRRPEVVLGEIAWHVAALASVFGLHLSSALRISEPGARA